MAKGLNIKLASSDAKASSKKEKFSLDDLLKALDVSINSIPRMKGSVVKPTGKKILVYVSKEEGDKYHRAELMPILNDSLRKQSSYGLSKSNVTWDEYYGTSGRIKILDDYYIELKPPSGAKGTGSGGGALLTMFAESAQCYYTAALWYRKGNPDDPITEADLTRGASHVQAYADGGKKNITLQDIKSNLGEDWITTSITIAKKLVTEMSGMKGNVTFHRGSSWVDNISKAYQNVNSKENKFANLNKWNPADIWIVSSSASYNFASASSFKALNNMLIDAINNKEIFPVSLKKTTGAVSNLNHINCSKTNKRPEYVYAGNTYGKKGYFDAMDCYIFFKEKGSKTSTPYEIQFRDFGVWQGEVKGSAACAGKVCAGPIQKILDDFKISIASGANIQAQATSLIQQAKSDYRQKQNTVTVPDFNKVPLLKNMWVMYCQAYPNSSDRYSKDDFFLLLIEDKKKLVWNSPSWIRSKYLGTELLLAVNKLPPSEKDRLVNVMVSYAKSQTAESGPHLKAT